MCIIVTKFIDEYTFKNVLFWFLKNWMLNKYFPIYQSAMYWLHSPWEILETSCNQLGLGREHTGPQSLLATKQKKEDRFIIQLHSREEQREAVSCGDWTVLFSTPLSIVGFPILGAP